MTLVEILAESTKNEAKEQKSGFLSILLETLNGSLLGICWKVKELIKLVKVKIFIVASFFE